MTWARFESVAGDYDTGRPPYPPALYDAVEELSGRGLRGATVVDVGAGTGIATRGLRERGAWVLALDRGELMLRRLRERAPELPVALADGGDLPVRDGAADLVTYAQSWHWLDPAPALAEALRVLRPHGAAAAWWNLPDTAVPWLAEHMERVAAACPDYRGYDTSGYNEYFARAPYDIDVQTSELSWSRTIGVETFLANLRSKSWVAALGEPAARELVERELLERLFPEGVLEEPYLVHLVVARRLG